MEYKATFGFNEVATIQTDTVLKKNARTSLKN